MNISKKVLIAAALSMAVAAPALAGNRLMPANTPARIANSALSVTPGRDWNRLSARPGRAGEVWTLDSDTLNNVTYYAGVEADRTLMREVDRRNRPLPRFSSTMLLADVPTLLENSYRVGRSVTVFSMDQVEPAQFAGQSGVRFNYSYTSEDEVRRRGEAYGAIVGGRLYLVTFEAPQIHFFDASIDAFRQLVATSTITARR
jgi:hypothetical protein